MARFKWHATLSWHMVKYICFFSAIMLRNKPMKVPDKMSEDSDLKTGFIPYFELFHPFSCNLLYFEQRVGLWWVHLLAKHAKPPRRVGSPPGHPQHPQISGRRKCAAWFWLGHRVVDGEKIPTASWFVGSFLQQASTPLKTNIVLEKGPRQKKTWSFNHQFSGDIIVFREVVLVSSIWHFRIIKFSLQQQSHMWQPCHLPNFSRFYQLCGKKTPIITAVESSMCLCIRSQTHLQQTHSWFWQITSLFLFGTWLKSSTSTANFGPCTAANSYPTCMYKSTRNSIRQQKNDSQEYKESCSRSEFLAVFFGHVCHAKIYQWDIQEKDIIPSDATGRKVTKIQFHDQWYNQNHVYNSK